MSNTALEAELTELLKRRGENTETGWGDVETTAAVVLVETHGGDSKSDDAMIDFYVSQAVHIEALRREDAEPFNDRDAWIDRVTKSVLTTIKTMREGEGEE